MYRSSLDEWIKKKCQINLEKRDELEAWQLSQVNDRLRAAKKQSSYYREKLHHISALGSMEDIALLPFTDSEILRNQGGNMLCVSQGEISRVVTLSTSGTEGQSKRVFFTEEDQELTVDFFHHGMATLAYPGEKALVALPCTAPGCVGDLLIEGLRRLGVSAIPHGIINNLQEVAEVLKKEQPQVCVGIPVQILGLAEYCARHHIKTGIKRVLLSTDYAPDALIGRIQKLWQCEVFNHYGMTEMGLGGAVECQAHQGMHIRENDLYVEVIDSLTGQVLPSDSEGELVFTTLTRTGMPLIRYRTGDKGMVTTCKCSCGSVLKRVMYVGERIQENSDGKTGIQQVDEEIFAVPQVIDYEMQHTGTGTILTVFFVANNRGQNLAKQIQSLPCWAQLACPEIKLCEIEKELPLYKGKRKI